MTATTRRPRYVGTLHLGANYSAPSVDSDAYVWDSLDDVARSVWSATCGHGVDARVAEWDDDGAARAGHYDDSVTPATDDVHAVVWLNVPGALDDAQREGYYSAARVVWRGSRGGIRVGALDEWSGGIRPGATDGWSQRHD
jgi:hypothetical protein